MLHGNKSYRLKLLLFDFRIKEKWYFIENKPFLYGLQTG